MNQNVLIAGAAAGAVLLILIIVLLVRRSRRRPPVDYSTPDYYNQHPAGEEGIVVNPQPAQVQPQPVMPQPAAQPNANPYSKLRSTALQTSARSLGITADSSDVTGVVMDWDLGDSTVTLAAFATGDASLYFSNGGAVIGGAGHQTVRESAKEFVSMAQQYVGEALPTSSAMLPGKENVAFHFITGNGLYRAQEPVSSFYNQSSKWNDLFEEGNKVIAELRIVAEDTEEPS